MDARVEPEVVEPKAVYISKRPVKKNSSRLPLIARRIYPLMSVRDLLEEQLTESTRVRKQRQLLGTLNGLNYKLKLEKGNREGFEGEGRVEAKLVAQRNAILVDLERVERSKADDLLSEVEPWAGLYTQEGEALTAYRMYRFQSGDGYTLYVEEEVESGKALVGGAKAVVVINSFDDKLARSVIEEWCGASEEGAVRRERATSEEDIPEQEVPEDLLEEEVPERDTQVDE